EDGLERWRASHGHLNGVESAPGDAEHSDVTVRPRLLGQPRDYAVATFLFLLRDLARLYGALTVTKTPDVYSHPDITVAREVGVMAVVLHQLIVVFSVGQ